MKRILLTLSMMLVSSLMMAQASGGQIRRIKTPQKTEYKKKTPKRANQNGSGDNYPEKTIKQNTYSYNPDVIEPLPLSNLATYNVVACSAPDIDNARTQCRSLREKGYKSEIYKDPNMGVYQILAGLTNDEKEAVILKNKAKKSYKMAWILYMVDGVQQIYRH